MYYFRRFFGFFRKDTKVRLDKSDDPRVSQEKLDYFRQVLTQSYRGGANSTPISAFFHFFKIIFG